MPLLSFFKHNFRTFRAPAAINLIGLAIALTSFMLIIKQVAFEYGYDRFRPAADRIYRVEWMSTDSNLAWIGGPGQYVSNVSRPDTKRWADLSPHIESSGCIQSWETTLDVKRADTEGQDVYSLQASYVSPSFPETMQMEIVQGKGLDDDLSGILIPQSLARTIFGDEYPIGKTVRPKDPARYANPTNQNEFRIAGVYRDLPNNSLIKNNAYIHLGESNSTQPGLFSYKFFLRLDSSQAKEDVEKLLTDKNLSICADANAPTQIRLTRLCDVYFDDCSKQSGGNRDLTRVFLWIAVLILVIAVVNYFNYSIAQVPLRIRSINIRKVFGASQGKLRGETIAESVLFFAAAYLIAVWGVLLLQYADPMSYLKAETLWSQNPWLLLWGLLLAAGIGALAGVYPAYYAARVSPALVLKGSFGLSIKGRRLRVTLIGFQYFVSIALAISALFMNLQYRKLCRNDLGFDRDRLVTIPLTAKLSELRNTLSAELLRIPGVHDAAYCAPWFFTSGSAQKHISDQDMDIQVHQLEASPSFPRVLGLSLYEGRSLALSDERQDEQAARPVLANRTFQKACGLKVGDHIDQGRYEIVGFVEDFHFKPLHENINPLIIHCLSPNSFVRLFIRVESDDYRRLLGSISKTIAALDPDWNDSPTFFDTHVELQYRAERKNTALITSFCLLAVMISLSGAFSLMLIETRYKRREIAVRRIFGATVAEILGRFNRPMIRTVLVCFALATPVTWYAMSKWLENYVVRMPLHWWVFALAMVVVLAVTVLTVTLQSLRTATENPVNALKQE